MPKVIKMGGPRALDCLKDHNTSPDRVSKTSPAKKSNNSKHKNQEKEHIPISHFKKRARSRSSSKHSSSSKRHHRSRSCESKNENRGTGNAPRASRTEERGRGNAPRGTANAPRKTSGKSMLNKDAKRKGIILFMMNKCTKKVVQKLVKNQNPDPLYTQLYLLVKEICHSGPGSGLIPTKMLKRGCSVWKMK